MGQDRAEDLNREMDPCALAEAYTAAWNTGRPEEVAAFFAPDGIIIINGGQPWRERAGVALMAQGFFSDIPDLHLVNDGVRAAGQHVVYQWTFTGTHSGSGNKVQVSGWEEWDLDAANQIAMSRGWFDVDDYSRQTSPQ